MATKRDVSSGFKKALLERTAGTGTMEEMMVEQAAVIAATSFSTFAYRHSGTGALCPDLEGIGGAERIFDEAEAATSGDRPALSEMIAILRAGDRVVVHSINGLARDMRDLQDIVGQINTKGAILDCQSEGLTFRADHDDPTSILQRRMLDAFSDFERALMRKRQTKSGAHD